MPAKYGPLVRYLMTQPGDRVTLTLAAIEAIIGVPLPPGARRRDWWQITPGRTALRPAILAAGWRIVLGGFWGQEPVVTFVRGGNSAPPEQA